MRAYATWQVAHQLARTSQSGRPTVSAPKYARSLVSEAIKLTRWLHAQQLELGDLRQDLLDAWIADGPGVRRRVRLFIAPAPTSPPSTCASAWRPTASPVAPVATAHCWRSPGRLPAPILAERLGIHQARAAQWARAAGATYAPYVRLRAERSARHG